MCPWERSSRHPASSARAWPPALACLALLAPEPLHPRNKNLPLFTLALPKKSTGSRCSRCRLWGRKTSPLGTRRGCNGACFWRETGQCRPEPLTGPVAAGAPELGAAWGPSPTSHRPWEAQAQPPHLGTGPPPSTSFFISSNWSWRGCSDVSPKLQAVGPKAHLSQLRSPGGGRALLTCTWPRAVSRLLRAPSGPLEMASSRLCVASAQSPSPHCAAATLNSTWQRGGR